ncbi:MAG: hypothetical protein SFW36_08035, partial [Leptolyngbyaceae cyanobacterium bins.59]|nr:hypothetical protein [Leptolyngbyaceae cyanobacterium bins.59]
MNDFDKPESVTDCQLDLNRDVMDWLMALQKADQTFSNIMTLELWSIAQTMDELRPGFWALYMENRQRIVRQQLEERRYPESRPPQPRPKRITPRRPSP